MTEDALPWSKVYKTNMEDLDNQLHVIKKNGNSDELLKTYTQWFDNDCKGHKLLIKGCSGIGKTAVARKIAWNWANGEENLKQFSVVLFVSMSLARTKESVEHIIIRQNPVLKDLEIRKTKLATMLEKLGPKLLVIIDGLDENPLEVNRDMTDILEGNKYAKGSFIFTLRSEFAVTIETHFSTIVEVKGLSRKYATTIASTILTDTKKVKSVLDVSLDNGTLTKDGSKSVSRENLYKYPLLLLFVCILTSSNEIRYPVSLGKVYYKALRFLYKRNRLCKGKDIDNWKENEKDNEEFTEWLRPIGKQAFRMLRNGPMYVSRENLYSVLGNDAFDCGIVRGHGDSNFLLDVDPNTYLTFPHISVQEFLGAFYCKKLIIHEKSKKSELFEVTKKVLDTPKALFDPHKLLEKNSFFRYFFDWTM